MEYEKERKAAAMARLVAQLEQFRSPVVADLVLVEAIRRAGVSRASPGLKHKDRLDRLPSNHLEAK